MFLDEFKEIKELYEEGTVPKADELSGEYYVVVPWFPWVSLALLKHRKSVEPGGDGENILLKNFRFGNFQLEEDNETLLINYDLDENPRIFRGVRDRLRRLSDGRLIGQFCLEIFGREHPLFYFEMVEKEKEEEDYDD